MQLQGLYRNFGLKFTLVYGVKIHAVLVVSAIKIHLSALLLYFLGIVVRPRLNLKTLYSLVSCFKVIMVALHVYWP